MSQPYVGEIRMFAGNFAPAGWMLCQGQTLPISENDVLFTLIGTTYGGDGQNTFALPNLQSRVPIHVSGSNPIGEMAGVESVTLTTNQIPSHNHSVVTVASPGNASTPSGSTFLANEALSQPTNAFTYIPYDGAAQVQLAGQSVGMNGGNQPHSNIQPYLTINFIISLFGVFPTQN